MNDNKDPPSIILIAATRQMDGPSVISGGRSNQLSRGDARRPGLFITIRLDIGSDPSKETAVVPIFMRHMIRSRNLASGRGCRALKAAERIKCRPVDAALSLTSPPTTKGRTCLLSVRPSRFDLHFEAEGFGLFITRPR